MTFHVAQADRAPLSRLPAPGNPIDRALISSSQETARVLLDKAQQDLRSWVTPLFKWPDVIPEDVARALQAAANVIAAVQEPEAKFALEAELRSACIGALRQGALGCVSLVAIREDRATLSAAFLAGCRLWFERVPDRAPEMNEEQLAGLQAIFDHARATNGIGVIDWLRRVCLKNHLTFGLLPQIAQFAQAEGKQSYAVNLIGALSGRLEEMQRSGYYLREFAEFRASWVKTVASCFAFIDDARKPEAISKLFDNFMRETFPDYISLCEALLARDLDQNTCRHLLTGLLNYKIHALVKPGRSDPSQQREVLIQRIAMITVVIDPDAEECDPSTNKPFTYWSLLQQPRAAILSALESDVSRDAFDLTARRTWANFSEH